MERRVSSVSSKRMRVNGEHQGRRKFFAALRAGLCGEVRRQQWRSEPGARFRVPRFGKSHFEAA